jgi:hypothetical protein
VGDKPPTEQVALKFAKFLLGTHKRSSNLAVRGELALYPMLLHQVMIMIKYWLKIMQLAAGSRLLAKCYQECQMLVQAGKPCWLGGIKAVLCQYQMKDLWEMSITNSVFSQSRPDISKIRESMEENYSALWLQRINKSPNIQTGNKLYTYASFKNNFALENYLLTMENKHKKSSYTKLRISAHNLMIETGRHKKPKKLNLSKESANNAIIMLLKMNFISSCTVRCTKIEDHT